MRCRQVCFFLDLFAANRFEKRGFSWIRCGVYNIKVRRPHPWNNQVFTFHAAICVTRRTRIPTHMMQLIPNDADFCAVDNLAIG